MSIIKAKIAHISDLHFGDHEGTLISHLGEKLLEEKPNVLVVSGDILDNPPIPGFKSEPVKEAKTFFHNLSGQIPNLIYAIGNHDVNLLGNVDLGRLLSSFISSFIPLELLTGGLGYRSIPPVDLFGSVKPVEFRFFNELGLSFFIFDSTPFRSPFNFAFGTVSDNALSEFKNRIKGIETGSENIDLESFRKSFKIAVLHHHPLPIAYSGSEKIALLTNAGTFLQQMLDYEIDMILHGHKHIWAIRRYSSFYGFKDYLFRDLLCISSGSTSKKGAQPFHFNIINVYADKTVELRSFSAENLESPFVESRKILLIGLHSAKRRYKRKTIRHLGYKCKCIEKEVDLNEEGDSTIIIKYIGLETVEDTSLGFLDVELGVNAGRVAKGLKIIHGEPYVEWEENGSLSTCQHLVGKLRFNPPRIKSYSPITFQYSYRTLNSHAMSDVEAEELYNSTRCHEATSHKIRVPCDEFKMTIKMPDIDELLKELSNDTINLLISDDKMKPIVAEEEKINCTWDSSGKTISLRIISPMFGFTYEVRWPLARKVQPKSGPFSHMVQEIQKRLLKLSRKASDLAPEPSTTVAKVREALKTFRTQLETIVTRKWEDEEFDVSLMVPDEEKNFVVVSCLFEYTSYVWELKFPAGVGQGWKAFKSNVCVGPKSDYYVEPQELGPKGKGLVKHSFLLSIPFNFYDNEIPYQIGVINIGSQKDTSYVGDILDEKNGATLRKAVADLYADVYNILVGEQK